MDRSVINLSTLNAGNSDNITLDAIPSGKVWEVQRFGAADINYGDNKSSVYLLRWGSGTTWENIMPIILTGNTLELPIIRDFLYHATNRLNVLRINYSGTNKTCPFWVKIVERQ